ncbi:MAG: ABC transporter substrate-binding protein [Chloroflexota bacterium]|nr:ABC transporter substrate-binding protein [Chloroflexota bacterium]
MDAAKFQLLSRRRLLQGVVGVAGGVLLAGCGRSAPAPAGTRAPGAGATQVVPTAAKPGSDVVRFAWWTDVGTMTPFQVSTAGPGGAVLLTLIYDTLTWKDGSGIVPWLASTWDVADDGSQYTFRLREDAAWHDNKPLTADDVQFSFDYYAKHPFRWMPTDVVASTEVSASHEVRIKLKRPYAAFLEDIAGVVPIIPRHVWAPVADPVSYAGPDASIGSGPYKLVAHNEEEGSYRLAANERYWRGRPLVSEWRQRSVPEEARVEIVRQGDADVSLTTDASVRDVLANDPRLKVFETAPLSLVRLAINTTRPPLDRKEVRQAIAYALDRKRLAETITRGPAIVGSAGVVPPETPWYHASVQEYGFDPAGARELLGGKRYHLELLANADAREPELMAPMLEAVGITLKVQRVDPPTRAQILSDGDFQIALTAHIGVGGDPDYLRRWYAGEEANAFAQGSVFQNEEFTRLGTQQAAIVNPEERRPVVNRMQEILAEELPTIVLYHRRFYWVYDPSAFTPMETWGGLMNGIPFPNNKLALIEA